MENLIFNIRLNYREVKSFLKFWYRINLINWKHKTNLKTFKLRLKWI